MGMKHSQTTFEPLTAGALLMLASCGATSASRAPEAVWASRAQTIHITRDGTEGGDIGRVRFEADMSKEPDGSFLVSESLLTWCPGDPSCREAPPHFSARMLTLRVADVAPLLDAIAKAPILAPQPLRHPIDGPFVIDSILIELGRVAILRSDQYQPFDFTTEERRSLALSAEQVIHERYAALIEVLGAEAWKKAETARWASSPPPVSTVAPSETPAR